MLESLTEKKIIFSFRAREFPLVPSSSRVFRGSIYSFPLVRFSCLLSADVLHALLCLKVYSWCVCGERCTPRPPTPPPSCLPLFFNILSRLVIASFPKSMCLYFMAAVTICNDFGAQKNKVSQCFHCFPIYLPWSDGTGCHDLSFLNVEF